MKIRWVMLFVLIVGFIFAENTDRRSAYPYVSGDTFREFSDFIYDETNREIDSAKVKYGDVIFVKADYKNDFFRDVHPRIEQPYILITHNGDDPCPDKCASYLDDDKLIAWFGQSTEGITHPKLFPIPIGLANRYWNHGNVNVVKTLQRSLPILKKSYLLYMNFSPNFPEERQDVYALFHGEPFCVEKWNLSFKEYLIDLAKSKFVLSPRGNSLDCHRTWEALLMGSIPIVKHSTLDSIYIGLPVIIINDWAEITEEFLNQKYEEMKDKKFDLDKLYAPYWFELINSFREK